MKPVDIMREEMERLEAELADENAAAIKEMVAAIIEANEEPE